MNSTTKPKPNPTALYMRVSTNEQRIDGYGLESQKRSLMRYVNRHSEEGMHTADKWMFSDVHTGSDFHRTGLQNLLQAVKSGTLKTVVVWKIDRLSRSLKHLLEIFDTFQKHNVNFISLQENLSFTGPIGNFIFQILSSVSELERSLINSRTRQGKITSAEMGNFTGTRVPFGYKPVPNPNGKGKKLEILPDEKQIVEEIFRLYVYEDMGYESIAKHLNAIKTPKGTHTKHLQKHDRWLSRHIERIIPNTLYRGEFVANRKDQNGELLPPEEWTIVAIPPCVSEITFALATRKRMERGGKRLNQGNMYLLSGKLVDVSIPYSRKFSGAPRTKGGLSYRRRQFTATDGTHYGVFELPAKAIEESIWEHVKLALKDPDVFLQKYLSAKTLSKENMAVLQQQILKLREQQANTALEQGRIDCAYESGLYSLKKAEEKTAEVTQKLDELQAKITETEQKIQVVQRGKEDIKGLKAASAQFKKNIENVTPKQKKLLIDVFVDRVEVDRKELPAKSTKQKKWKRSLEVFFRFNPSHFGAAPEVRTDEASSRAKKQPSKGENESLGGESGGRYTFSFKFELVKERVYSPYNRHCKVVKLVAV